MRALRRNGSRVYRFMASQLLSITSTAAPAACLVLASLTALAIFSFACNSPTPTETLTPPPTHYYTPTPAVSNTPAPTVSQIPTPTTTLLPPVTLEEPENGSCFNLGSEVTLRWEYPYVRLVNESYQLRVRAKGQDSFFFYLEEDHFALPTLSPGEYDWAVAIVRSTGQDRYELVGKESDWYSFAIAPPGPVVNVISPTSTFQGASVPVVISGENFTRSLALTIGVPLQATFVNSSTIIATVPTTLGVGEYPVIVRDSNSRGISFASFIVSRSPTPAPTARPRYARPELTGVDIYGSDVTFRWSWTGKLADNDYFALRVGTGTPEKSRLWTKETQASWRLTEQGDYVWEVAICRGDPAEADCSGNKQLVVSEQATFWFAPPPEPKPTPKPP
jgi:hypothetical protein